MTDASGPPRALPPNVFPPERVEAGGLHLRRPTLADTDELHAAVVASFAELHAWMPWCTDPVEIGQQRSWIERGPDGWTSLGMFHWLIADDRDALLGSISLMDRIGPGALEIGYWLRSDATGRGVMTRAAASVTEVGLALPGIGRVEIRCDAANLRSAAVPRRLGYRLAQEVRVDPAAPSDSGLDQHWVTP